MSTPCPLSMPAKFHSFKAREMVVDESNFLGGRMASKKHRTRG
jgi:hypothetical protein